MWSSSSSQPMDGRILQDPTLTNPAPFYPDPRRRAHYATPEETPRYQQPSTRVHSPPYNHPLLTFASCLSPTATTSTPAFGSDFLPVHMGYQTTSNHEFNEGSSRGHFSIGVGAEDQAHMLTNITSLNPPEHYAQSNAGFIGGYTNENHCRDEGNSRRSRASRISTASLDTQHITPVPLTAPLPAYPQPTFVNPDAMTLPLTHHNEAFLMPLELNPVSNADTTPEEWVPPQGCLYRWFTYLKNERWVKENRVEPNLRDNQKAALFQDTLFSWPLGFSKPDSQFDVFLEHPIVKLYRCRWCSEKGRCTFSATRKDQARAHIYGHFDYSPIVCNGQCGIPNCDRKYKIQGRLNDHIKRSSYPTMTCNACNMVLLVQNKSRHSASCIGAIHAV